MAKLSLSFFDTFQATLGSREITRFRSSNNRGLLVYLALQNDRSFPREVLATLLWPEESENNARNNLRQSIYQLRKVLGDLDQAGEPYLLVTRQTVRFNADSDYSLDVNRFLQMIEKGNLEAAVSEYQGELLAGFSCDSPLLEDWLRQEREHLHQIALKAMFELTQRHLQDGRLDLAQTTARRQLGLEPWREPAHCQLMQAYALAGDRSNALAQYEVCRKVLWDELGVEPAAETVAVYESVKTGDFGPVATDDSIEPPFEAQPKLPLFANTFIGREAELSTLSDFLANSSERLVTIVGPGGIGKTRLATALAERILEARLFPDGVFFFDLAPLLEMGHILEAIADSLSFPLLSGDSQSSKRQLLNYLKNKRLLFVFDNFEHLIDSAALVADILQSCREIKILVTSRERLHLHLEQAYPIQGLEFPDWETPEDAAEYTAVRLFLQSARRNLPNFVIHNDADLTYLARICRLVGGMPLALELAASWVDTLTLADIASELQQGLDILETELRDVPERQRSVRASFDYSWRKLDELEQAVFAQLSVFRGGFTRAAAHQVTGASLGQLSRLVNKSIIKFNEQHGRYEIHELLRQFGIEKLGEQPELESTTYNRQSHYYLQLLAGFTNDLKGAGKKQALTIIDSDRENVSLAWNHAIANQNFEDISVSLESLWRFYWDYGRVTVSDFERAVAKLRIGEATGDRGITLGRLLAPLGRFYARAGKTTRAREILEDSLDLLLRLGASDERLIPLLFLAEVQESIDDSNRLFREGLALARASGDQWAIGHALLFLGWNSRSAGDFPEAEQLLSEALRQFRQTGDKGGISFTLTRLSQLAIDRGRYEDALALARESWSITAGFTPLFRSAGLWVQGLAHIALGEIEKAEVKFQRLTILASQLGVEQGPHELLFRLGEIAFYSNDYTLASQRYQESLVKASESGDANSIVQIHNALGRLARIQRKGLEARKHFHSALRNALLLGRRPLLLDCLACVAELFVDEGALDYAALLVELVTGDSASRASSKERSTSLIAYIEADISPNELDGIRQRSRPGDLLAVATQLLVDLET